ncbi:hypothetical protein BDP27DRAFT_1446330 [Rhodocollybia butyracea]|uniref:Uncharacterized protein n=1 Tax=Rhodocollybia butyracea TaxID=206335 RepID=A0A9P5PXX2_9AGAR|nr:hypothetical protein BDP27DRAFT_1446330 [Rhodocollybia butyracea]
MTKLISSSCTPVQSASSSHPPSPHLSPLSLPPLPLSAAQIEQREGSGDPILVGRCGEAEILTQTLKQVSEKEAVSRTSWHGRPGSLFINS